MITGDRIRERREALGMSQDELARKLGYKSRSSINKIELGIQELPGSKIKTLAAILNVSTNYLLENAIEEASRIEMQLTAIPVYSRISCGTGTWIDDRPDEYVGVPCSMAGNGKYFANHAKGDSMEPRIKEGDLLIFRETPTIESGQIGSFSLNGEYFCKRLRILRDGTIILASDNPQYEPIYVAKEDQFKCLGLYKFKLSKEQ